MPRLRRLLPKATKRQSDCSEFIRKQLDALAEALVNRETLDEQEILTVTGLPPAPVPDARPLPVSKAS